MTTPTTCSQCDTPAMPGFWLCVQHYLMFQQAQWLGFTQTAAIFNQMERQIAIGHGGLIPPNYIEIPPPPSMGDNLTFNNINVTDSQVGLVNTGTIKRIQRLDASITIFAAKDNDELAEALKCFTQRLFDSEVAPSAKEEIAQQLEYLVAQAQAEPTQRSPGINKSVLAGIEQATATLEPLVKAWANLKPLLKTALQILS